MVKVRLTRMGSKKSPFYRIIATHSRTPRDGRFLEILGYYDPVKNPAVLHVKQERVDYWVSVGAQMSDTVASLLRKHKKETAAAQA